MDFVGILLTGPLDNSNECLIQGPKMRSTGGRVRRLSGSSPQRQREIKFPLIDFKCDFLMHNCGFEGRYIPPNCGGGRALMLMIALELWCGETQRPSL